MFLAATAEKVQPQRYTSHLFAIAARTGSLRGFV
jgi:hypothetical protein